LVAHQPGGVVKLAFVILSRNKPAQLQRTLRRLAQTPAITLGSEVVVVDDASQARLVPPSAVADVPVRMIALHERLGRRGWDVGLRELERPCDWALLLDQRTCPAGDGWLDALAGWSEDVACVNADLFAISREGEPSKRLQGGTPEAITRGCVAVRPLLMQAIGGYANAFRSEVAEVALAARVLRAGLRTVMDPRLLAVRERSHSANDGRRVTRYTRELLAFVHQFAPLPELHESLRIARARARALAANVGSVRLAAAGAKRYRRDRGTLKRDPLANVLWDRLTGLAAARDALSRQLSSGEITRVAITDASADAAIVVRALRELGVTIVHETDRPQALVIGSLATGDILTKYFARSGNARAGSPKILTPWLPELPKVVPTSPACAA